ncbi:hydroxymethylglutaryl-CoA reductase [Bifidobacterium sp. ESL0704]|uniref:hydroxymethylglutaryl-CoA reductase n=1 Tax=Bifidobacterium sp. ESL0704 TaxID=2983219 RepID=UPI0023FA3BF3|nr:hydroxymethylglutaryl-CoA reductase [Bifidobacterium sp. ESL0704]WEV52704.1 hydroxymethylglutaryl-CoA reductase [Bifidobacterium sp. ESL0704]
MTKFYELSTAERLAQLRDEGAIDDDDLPVLTDEPALPTGVAANMVENQIGNFPVPLGLADHFVIDGEALRVPMAVEEPSVIAAAGNAAHRIARAGGFRTSVRRDGITAQIVFMESGSSRTYDKRFECAADRSPDSVYDRATHSGKPGRLCEPNGGYSNGRKDGPEDTGTSETYDIKGDEAADSMVSVPPSDNAPKFDEASRLATFVRRHEAEIRKVAHDAHPSLQTYGGGLRNISVSVSAEGFSEIDLLIDPGDAMGANVVNTIAEAVAKYCVKRLDGLDLLMAILSNDTRNQRARAQARIDFDDLATRDMDGSEVARRIVAAARFAEISPLRAATHNKGIMNGINAVVLATGNDTRNINAAAYADLNDQRRTWTQWSVDEERHQLVGRIDIPLPLGSVGGAMSTLPMAKLSLKLLHQPDASRLMGIVASVGLASNLSAMRALVTRGIQEGHMNLQFKSLAMSAGARPEELAQVVSGLRADPAKADLQTAQRLLGRLRKGLDPC